MRINAVFEGGGVKAIGLVGGIKAAQEKGFIFKQVAGTSSGAIVSALLAAGYTADEMKEIIMSTPFSQFLHSTALHKIGWIGPSIRLMLKKGLYSGKPIEQWIAQLLRKKGIRTFADLKPRQLRIIASDLTRGKMLVLPDDIREYGVEPADLNVSTAVMMSSAIPYFFEPVVIKKGLKDKNVIVDGAILSNFPLWLFDQSNGDKCRPAIGFHLVGKNQYKPHRIYGPISMLRALFSTMMEAHDERYIERKARFRTIKIPTYGIKTTDFDITPEQSLKLFYSGYESAHEFFENWSVSGYMKQYEAIVEK